MYMKCLLVCVVAALCGVSQVQGQNASEALDFFGNLTDKVPTLRLIYSGSKSYFIGDIFKGNFFQAEQFCRYHAMNLVNIETEAENEFLRQNLIAKGDTALHFWNSGTKLPDNERWISFTTAQSMPYFNWYPGEPNNAKKNEYCIEMRFADNKLTWNDADCNSSFNFICQTKLTQDCERLYELLIKTETQALNLIDRTDIRTGVAIE